MSYIVRTGVVTASTALFGESERHYAYLTVESTDSTAVFAENESPSTTTTFNVQVFGVAAERIVRFLSGGHTLRIVFAGRFIVRETQGPDGRVQQVWDVGAEHIGISVEDESLLKLFVA